VIERIWFFIEDVYHRKRPYTALGYRFPDEYENLLADTLSGNEVAKNLIGWPEMCIPRSFYYTDSWFASNLSIVTIW